MCFTTLRLFVESTNGGKKLVPITLAYMHHIHHIMSADCLSVCPLAYLRNHTTKLHQIFVLVACGCGSVLP